MPSNNTAHDHLSDGGAPPPARHRQRIGTRLTTWGTRLLGSAKNPPAHEPPTPPSVRQRVLREYHEANLAAARAVSEELVRAGCNTGSVPYGYRTKRVRITPAGRRARWRTMLQLEPIEAFTVRRIFTWRVEHARSIDEIRHRLVTFDYPAPMDPGTGESGIWTSAAVRAILRNPKYLGHQVWGRTHHGKRTSPLDWVWSMTPVHRPLITSEMFSAAHASAINDHTVSRSHCPTNPKWA